MAYSRDFENDLFISFAHQDDTGGWITQFHSQLANRFAQLLGGAASKVIIWRDPALRPTSMLSPEILGQLGKTAVLLSIITPCSVDSEWCINERVKFQYYAELNGGLRVGTSIRMVNVIKTPLRNDAHRGMFGALDCDFYLRDLQSGHFSEYLPNDTPFEQGINALAQSLLQFFDELNRRPPQDSRDAVFVALAAPDTRRTRDKIVQELKDLKLTVLPPDVVSVETPGFTTTVEDCLSRCRVAVHFAGANAGITPEGETTPLTALQLELALKYQLPRVVWIEPGAKVNAPFQAALASGDQPGTEILDNPSQTVADLKRIIVTALGDAKEPPPEDSKLHIYLLCDGADYPTSPTVQTPNISRQVQEFLTQKGHTVWLPLAGAQNKQEQSDDHIATLAMSDAVVLLWGETEEAWFRERVRELATIETRRAHRPLRARAALLAPPPSVKHQYRRGFLDLVIDLMGSFAPEQFADFEKRLKLTVR